MGSDIEGEGGTYPATGGQFLMGDVLSYINHLHWHQEPAEGQAAA